MRCQTTLELFQTYLFENTDDISADLVPHLYNCEYCRRDFQTILSKQPIKIASLTGANWLKIKQALYQVPINEKGAYRLTLLEDKSFLEKCFYEINQAKQDFISNPKGFILSVMDDFLAKDERPYLSQGWRVATAIWVCSFISLCTYGFYGFNWFGDNTYYYPKKQTKDPEYIVTYIKPFEVLSPKWLPGYSNKNSTVNKQAVELSHGRFIEVSTEKRINPPALTAEAKLLNGRELSTINVVRVSDSISPASKQMVTGRFISSSNINATGIHFVGSVEARVVASPSGSMVAQVNKPRVENDYSNDDEDYLDANASNSNTGSGQSSASNSAGFVLTGQGSAQPAPAPAGSYIFGSVGSSQPTSNLPSTPTTAKLVVLNPTLKVGQIGLVGIVLQSNNQPITAASFTIRFNPNVIKVRDIKDGGLLSLNGVRADFTYNVANNTVAINITRPKDAPVYAFGQAALIYFTAFGEGSTDIEFMNVVFTDANGNQSAPVAIVNTKCEVHKDLFIDDSEE